MYIGHTQPHFNVSLYFISSTLPAVVREHSLSDAVLYEPKFRSLSIFRSLSLSLSLLFLRPRSLLSAALLCHVLSRFNKKYLGSFSMNRRETNARTYVSKSRKQVNGHCIPTAPFPVHLTHFLPIFGSYPPLDTSNNNLSD